MYSFFLKNNLVNSAILVVILILLRCILLFTESPDSIIQGGVLFDLIQTPSYAVNFAIGTALLVIQLIIIMDISIRFRISSEASLIPGLMFVVLCMLIPDYGMLNPVLVANTLLLPAIWALLSISPRRPSAKLIFNAGMLVALATMCHGSYIVMVIAMLSGINILRSYRFNDLKILLLGFLAPFIIIGTLYFHLDRWDQFTLSNGFGWPDWRWIQDYTVYFIGLVWVLILITIIIQQDAILSKKIINKQNIFKIFFWILAVSLIQVLMQDALELYHLGLVLLPAAFLLSEYLVNSSVNFSAAIANVLMAIGIIFPFSRIILSSFGF